jgi:uncharacterized OB-fold protein
MGVHLEGIVSPNWVEESESESFRLARLKSESEGKYLAQAAEKGLLVVETVVNLPFRESAGIYLTKFFTAIRDEGKIIANRCPACKRVVLPPRIVCGFCKIKIEDEPGNWITLKDTGMVMSYTINVEREVDYATNKLVGQAYPIAFIRLDGGDQYSILVHFLKEIQPSKISVGMKVKAVWKPYELRRGRMSDILYFETIGGDK